MSMLFISWLTRATLECVTFIKYAFYLAAANSRSVVRNFSGMLHSSGAASTESCCAFPLPSQPCQAAYPEGSLAQWKAGSCQTFLLKRGGVTWGMAEPRIPHGGPLAARSLCLQELWLKQAVLVHDREINFILRSSTPCLWDLAELSRRSGVAWHQLGILISKFLDLN